jgi:hypothetical protein
MSASDEPQNTQPPSNAERLRSHLKPQSLATALLSAWNPTEPLEKRRERLLQTLNSHNTGNTQIDDASATDED